MSAEGGLILQLNKITDDKVSQSEKLETIRLLREADISYFENNIRLILDIAKYLENRCLGTYLEPECELFVTYLQAISELASYSTRKGQLVKEYLLELFKTKILKVPVDIKVGILDALSHIVKSYPEIIIDSRDVFRSLLETSEEAEFIKKVIGVIGDASWVLPQIVVDYIKIFREIMEEKKSKDVEDLFYIAISKAARRNFYVVKTIVSSLIEDLYQKIDKSKLFFLSNIEFPPEHMGLASQLYDVLELKYRSIEDKEVKKLVILTIGRTAKLRDFYDLQVKLQRFLVETLNEEVDKDIKINLIETVAIPHWDHRVDLTSLINILSDIAVNVAEEEDVRIAAINSLFKISLLPSAPREQIVNSFIDILYESGSEEPKSYVLDYIPTLLKTTEARSKELISLLIDFIGRVEEEDFLRIKAADILVSITKAMYQDMIELSSSILDVWKIATEWTIRDSLVKLAGELLVKSNIPDKNLISILIDALKDTYIYREALTYLYIISKRLPENVVHYIYDIIDTYKTIASVEDEMLQTVDREGFSEDYYYMVETPKRIIPRILINLIKVKMDEYDKVVDNLLDQFENEINELIVREVAFSLSQAYELNRERFKMILTKHLLREDRLALLKEFGVYI